MEKANLWLPGDREQEINGRLGLTLLHTAQITNKDLLQSTGNSTQYSVMAYMGKNLKKSVYIYIHTHIYLLSSRQVMSDSFATPRVARQVLLSMGFQARILEWVATSFFLTQGSNPGRLPPWKVVCVCVCVYVCVCVSLIYFAVQEKLTQHYKSTIRQ